MEGEEVTAVQVLSGKLLAFLRVAGRTANTPKFLLSQHGKDI